MQNKATEETFWCPQTFIVRILIIDKHVPMGFYSETQKGKLGKSPVEIERAHAWGVCIARNKVSVSGKVNVWNCSCVNYFLQLNLFKLREGESGK